MRAQQPVLTDYWLTLDIDRLAEHLEADHGLSRLAAWNEALQLFRLKVLELEEQRLNQAATGAKARRKPQATPGGRPPGGPTH